MPVYNYKKGTFSNQIELEKGMTAVLKQAQENTLERMMEELKKFITNDVYNVDLRHTSFYYAPYERTYDLYDIWDSERVYVSHGKIYGSIEPSKSENLTHYSILSQHTSPEGYKGSWTDLTTKDYVHIINDGLDKAHSMFGEIQERPFWDNFMEWAKKNYPRIFAEECKKLGINIQ